MKRLFLFVFLMMMGVNSINAQSNEIYDDVNGDTQVSMNDVISILNIILENGDPASNLSADINKDGNVTVADMVQLINTINDGNNDIEQYAINLSSTEQCADILVYNVDGSYILLKEGDNGYGWIHINSSVENEPQNGATILIGEDGKPMMLTIPDGHFVFANVTDESFDFAFIDSYDEVKYCRNMRFDDGMLNRTRGFLNNPWTQAWKDLWRDKKNGWDEHNKRALKPYLKKVFAMTLSSGLTFGIGFFITVYSEAVKSADKDCMFTDILGLSGSLNGDWRSLLSFGINDEANREFEELGRIEEWVGPNLKSEEWQIKLSKNLMEFSSDERWEAVDVDSKAKWKIDDLNVDKNWCEVIKLNSQVVVHVKENKRPDDRTCMLIISAENTTEIESVVLSIKQSGIENGLMPITLEVEEVGETTAKVWGRIEGHKFLDETVRYGLGYIEVGNSGSTGYDAHSVDDNGNYYVNFVALKPNTTYKYFAYLTIDGETYYGEDREFTTKEEEKKEAYYVKIGYSATYYYDEKCKSRGGHPISGVHNVSDIGLTSDTPLREVTFDSTFSDFHPLRFSFNHCSDIWSIENLNYLNTSYITDMSYMFAYCSILSSLDLSSFDTANVTDMGGMFQGCNSLKSLDLSSFNTANVNNMMQMFYGCTSLTDLNLNSFNTAKVTNMKRMFENCKSMTSLDLNSFNTANVTDMEDMFGCSSLQNLDFRNFNTSNLSSRDGIFGCDALVSLDISNLVLTNENGRALFDGLRKLQDLNLSNANTSNATDMSAMFRNCKSLISIDLSSFNTTNVTRMSEMFSGCSSLTNLNLNGFNTTKVKSMWYMFDGCSSLTTLDLSSFDTSNVTDIRSMFSLCSSLTALDLSSFSISNVSASGMFYGCSSLTTIYAGNWVIDKGGGMFYLCKNLVGDKGTKIGQNLYDYDKDGNPLYYYCSDGGSAAHIDGGKDNPGLFTAK